MKHTGTNWAISPEPSFYEGELGDVNIRTSPDGIHWIASMSGCHLGLPEGEVLANAALAAAAPQMLAALRLAASVLPDGCVFEQEAVDAAIHQATTIPQALLDHIAKHREIAREEHERHERAEFERLAKKFGAAEGAK